MRTSVTLSSFLASVAALTIASTSAQIPNGGFETWNTVGTYDDPAQWITFNGLTSLAGADPSCAQGTPGAVGNYYATLTTRNTTFGLFAGSFSVGNPTTGSTGFAFTSRPDALTGQWQYAIQPSDSGFVGVYLTKWNTSTMHSDSIGGGVGYAIGTLSGWQPLNIPLEYFSAVNPDTAYVFVTSSLNSPVDGSFIKIDDLGFGAATSLAEQDQVPDLRIYPSLATDLLHVAADGPIAFVKVMDLTGRTVLEKPVVAERTTVQLADLPAGRYFMHVRMQDGKRQVCSFVKE
ncbi:MAG: T9SS type A sorting domain-containing protein [Flavobacteriales bacterium]|nr:T9SS type A sorting domain-containing protein [Flavobacteriales bacterium]